MDLSVVEHGDVTAHEVALALQRLKGGSFGCCVECGESISHKRLKALPYARTSVSCQPED